jgi:hypothetical protein
MLPRADHYCQGACVGDDNSDVLLSGPLTAVGRATRQPKPAPAGSSSAARTTIRAPAKSSRSRPERRLPQRARRSPQRHSHSRGRPRPPQTEPGAQGRPRTSVRRRVLTVRRRCAPDVRRTRDDRTPERQDGEHPGGLPSPRASAHPGDDPPPHQGTDQKRPGAQPERAAHRRRSGVPRGCKLQSSSLDRLLR